MEKSGSQAVFLDVVKAFDTIWIDGFVYKLTVAVACGLQWLRVD